MSFFVTSDLHFNHNKPFIYEPRGFKSIEEMNAEIIKRHNEVVKSDDYVYILGDLMFGPDNKTGIDLINSMNGRKYIIRGNHDGDKRTQNYIYGIIKLMNIPMYARMIKYRGYHFYLSHYPTITSNFDDNKKGLKSSVINLCGHSHTKDFYSDNIKYNIPCYHVELDTNNCYPWNLDDIIQKIKNKVRKDLDYV